MSPPSSTAPDPVGSPEPAGPVPLTLASGRRAVARPPRHLADLPLAERRAVVAGLGQPPFRASQLSRHFFGRYTDQTDDMTDLPLAARDPLARALLPRLLTAERELSCDAGTTRKTLWRTFDGALVESVLMRYPDRVTMCVSSQAGCGMACPFCATGQAGRPATCPRPRSSPRWWRARGCSRPARSLRGAEGVEGLGGKTPPRSGGVWGGRPPGETRPESPTWYSWAWGSRWLTTRTRWARCAG